MARTFKLVVTVIDNESDGTQTIEDIKRIYQNEVLNNQGYDINFTVESVEEIQPQS